MKLAFLTAVNALINFILFITIVVYILKSCNRYLTMNLPPEIWHLHILPGISSSAIFVCKDWYNTQYKNLNKDCTIMSNGQKFTEHACAANNLRLLEILGTTGVDTVKLMEVSIYYNSFNVIEYLAELIPSTKNYYAFEGLSLEAAKILLHSKLGQSEYVRQCLYYMAHSKCGTFELFDLMIKHAGCDTLAWFALSNGNFELAKAIIHNGANEDQTNYFKISCLKGHVDLAEFLSYYVVDYDGILREVSTARLYMYLAMINCNIFSAIFYCIKDYKKWRLYECDSKYIIYIYESLKKDNPFLRLDQHVLQERHTHYSKIVDILLQMRKRDGKQVKSFP